MSPSEVSSEILGREKCLFTFIPEGQAPAGPDAPQARADFRLQHAAQGSSEC
jgi:hypothetical protein